MSFRSHPLGQLSQFNVLHYFMWEVNGFYGTETGLSTQRSITERPIGFQPQRTRRFDPYGWKDEVHLRKIKSGFLKRLHVDVLVSFVSRHNCWMDRDKCGSDVHVRLRMNWKSFINTLMCPVLWFMNKYKWLISNDHHRFRKYWIYQRKKAY